jgi:hypothetical protein
MRKTTIYLFITLAATVAGQTKLANGPNFPTLLVANLPAASAVPNQSLYVSDSSSGCAAGGGSGLVLCRSNGSTWVAISGSSSSPGLYWIVSGQSTSTISIPAAGPFQCNGVVTPIPSGNTTITLVTGSASDTLNLAISCSPTNVAHLRVYTASRTVNVTCAGFISCDTVTSAVFQFGDYPLGSVAIPASSTTFGGPGPIILSSQGSFNPTAGNCQSIVPSGFTITFSIQSVCIIPARTIATTSPATDPGTNEAYLYNNSSGAMTFPLPTAAGTQRRCYRNATARTGVITISVASGDTVDYAGTNGTTSTGTLVSTGAAGDEICLVSDAVNHWYATKLLGSWTNN